MKKIATIFVLSVVVCASLFALIYVSWESPYAYSRYRIDADESDGSNDDGWVYTSELFFYTDVADDEDHIVGLATSPDGISWSKEAKFRWDGVDKALYAINDPESAYDSESEYGSEPAYEPKSTLESKPAVQEAVVPVEQKKSSSALPIIFFCLIVACGSAICCYCVYIDKKREIA